MWLSGSYTSSPFSCRTFKLNSNVAQYPNRVPEMTGGRSVRSLETRRINTNTRWVYCGVITVYIHGRNGTGVTGLRECTEFGRRVYELGSNYENKSLLRQTIFYFYFFSLPKLLSYVHWTVYIGKTEGFDCGSTFTSTQCPRTRSTVLSVVVYY